MKIYKLSLKKLIKLLNVKVNYGNLLQENSIISGSHIYKLKHHILISEKDLKNLTLEEHLESFYFKINEIKLINNSVLTQDNRRISIAIDSIIIIELFNKNNLTNTLLKRIENSIDIDEYKRLLGRKIEIDKYCELVTDEKLIKEYRNYMIKENFN